MPEQAPRRNSYLFEIGVIAVALAIGVELVDNDCL